jgi:pyruvate,orthophosphate dikinase
MLGHRGCRLGLTRPEIYDVQLRALAEAACAQIAAGARVAPQVLFPMVSAQRELEMLCSRAHAVIQEVARKARCPLEIPLGSMVETPRAALLAAPLASMAGHLSFGTNDLTQTVFGLSRDDAGELLELYERRGILAADPFEVLDTGVGELVRLAVRRARSSRPGVILGICGEQGADPRAVLFAHREGIDYVSCSPYRVPIVRLLAAQAAILEPEAIGRTQRAR